MSTFLLEIGSEELPAGFVPKALEFMKERAGAWLQEQRLPVGAMRTAGTPRRLVLEIKDVAARQADVSKEVKGPAAKAAFDAEGQPTKAALGFARSQGVPVESLERKTIAGGEFVFALQHVAGRPAAEVLGELVGELVTHIPLKRGMRWADYALRFERPIRWLVALLDDQAIPAAAGELQAGRDSYGHRFLAGKPVRVGSAGSYWDDMAGAHVQVEPEGRARLIEEQVQAVAKEAGGHIRPDPALLEEVTYLVEEPRALLGGFDKAFLEIPEEVSTTVMKRHQRYFPVYDSQERLLPNFVVVSNGSGDPAVVRAGNERVLRARLSDARFFYHEDLKAPLGQRVKALQNVTFMEGVGTLYDKIPRLQALAARAFEMLPAGRPEVAGLVARAAELCKADLTTNMVRELTELQGVMGRHYALQAGEPAEVAEAIAEHYLGGPNAAQPQSPMGIALSLAEKCDNLAACFGRGLVPTGSQDPFALRRQGSALVLMSWEGDRHLDAEALLHLAAQQLRVPIEALQKLEEFMLGRLRGHLIDRNLRHDVVDAALASGQPLKDLLLPKLKAHALQEWLHDNPAAEKTVFSGDRCARLAASATDDLIDEGLFEKDSEGALFAQLQAADEDVSPLVQRYAYGAALKRLEQLNDAVERFFDFHEGVFVMVKDNPALQRNRLALLKRLSNIYANMADFRLLAVKQEAA